MRYSIEPRDRVYVKGYGFLSFAKNIGKDLSDKYSQKLVDTAKKSATDVLKRATQETTEVTCDLIGNKIADKITDTATKKSNKNIPTIDEDRELTTITNKKSYISPKERQQIIGELRLVPI